MDKKINKELNIIQKLKKLNFKEILKMIKNLDKEYNIIKMEKLNLQVNIKEIKKMVGLNNIIIKVN